MSTYFRNGNTYRQASRDTVDIYDQLPAGTYTIKVCPQSGAYYFEVVDNLTLPPKLYGDTARHAERIIHSFKARPASTGVCLVGEKGSGKTLLGKVLTNRLREEDDIPTIIINTNHCGEAFNTFIQQMVQPAVIFFDEFEKIYDDHEQEQVLTLLDGVYSTKKLFILTSNDKWKIDKNMRNRPGRLFYFLEYKGLTMEFVREYAQENLNNKGNVEGLVNVSQVIGRFNFDMLKALVEEMNRFDECASEAVEMLNVMPDGNTQELFNVTMTWKGMDIPEGWFPAQIQAMPLSHKPTAVHYYGDHTGLVREDYDKEEWAALSEKEKAEAARNEELRERFAGVPRLIQFTNGDIESFDVTSGVFNFKKGDLAVRLTRCDSVESFDYTKFLI